MKISVTLDLTQYAEGLKTSVKMAQSAGQQMKLVLGGMNVTPDFSEIDNELNKLQGELSQTTQETKESTNAIRNLQERAEQPDWFSKFRDGVANMGFAIQGLKTQIDMAVNAVNKFITPFADLEAQLDKLQAVAGATTQELKELSEMAEYLGMLPGLPFTAADVTSLQIEYAKLGFTVKEIMDTTESTLYLSMISGDGLAEAASVAGESLNAMGLDASETSRVVDVMAKSFTSSALDMSKFRESFKLASPITHSFGMTVEETTALLGKLADKGISASIAGTGLRTMISQLADPASKLNELFHGEVKTFDQLVEKMQELKAGHFTLADAAKYTERQSRALFLALVDSSDELGEYKIALNNASGTAKIMAEIMSDNLKGAALGFTSALEGAAITLGKKLEPAIKSVLEKGADLISWTMEHGTTVGAVTTAILAYIVAVKTASIATAIHTSMIAAESGALSILIGKLAAMKVALLAHPYALLAAAAATALYFMIDHFNKLKKAEDDAKIGIEEMASEFDKFTEKKSKLDVLLATYDELSTKTNLSAEEQTTLNKTIGEIGDILPGAITQVDNYGTAIGISTEKVNYMIEAEQTLLRVRNESAIKQAILDYSTYAILQDETTSNLESENEALEAQGAKYVQLQQRYKNYQDAIALAQKMGTSVKDYTMETESLETLMDNYEKAGRAYDKMFKQYSENNEKSQANLKEYGVKTKNLVFALSASGIDFEKSLSEIADQMGVKLEDNVEVITLMKEQYLELLAINKKEGDGGGGGKTPEEIAAETEAEQKRLADLREIQQYFDLRAIADADERKRAEIEIERAKALESVELLKGSAELKKQINDDFDAQIEQVQTDRDKITADKAQELADILKDIDDKSKSYTMTAMEKELSRLDTYYGEKKDALIEAGMDMLEAEIIIETEKQKAIAAVKAKFAEKDSKNIGGATGKQGNPLLDALGLDAEQQEQLSQGYSAITSRISSIFSNMYQKIQQERNDDLKDVEKRAKEEGWSAEKLAKEKQLIEADYRRKKKALRKKEQAMSVIDATINTAVAVTEALPNIPLAIAIGILGAIEVAMIASQKYAKGGLVKGSNQLIQVNEEGEEYVINHDATDKLGVPILNYINKFPLQAKGLLSGLPSISANTPQFSFATGGPTGNSGIDITGEIQKLKEVMEEVVMSIKAMNLNMVQKNKSQEVNILVETTDPEIRIRKDEKVKNRIINAGGEL